MASYPAPPPGFEPMEDLYPEPPAGFEPMEDAYPAPPPGFEPMESMSAPPSKPLSMEDLDAVTASGEPTIGNPKIKNPAEKSLWERWVAASNAESDMMVAGAQSEFVDSIAKGTMSGGAQIGEAVGTGLKYLGGRTGSETLTNLGEETQKGWVDIGKGYEAPEDIQGSIVDKPELLLDPSWWAYNVAQTGTSMLPGMVAGVGVGGAAAKGIQILGKMYKWTPTLARRIMALGYALPAGVIGGAQEGASTYEEVLKRGGTEEEAARAMEAMTTASGILNSISFGKIFSKLPDSSKNKVVSYIRKFIETGATEAITEYGEEPAEILIKMGLTKRGMTPAEIKDQLKQGVNVIPAAFITGGGAGIIGSQVNETASQTPLPSPQDQLINTVSNAVADFKTGVISPDQLIESVSGQLDNLNKFFIPETVVEEPPAKAIHQLTSEELTQLPIEEQQRHAFGMADKDIISITPDKLSPTQLDDPGLVKARQDMADSGLSPEEWAKQVNLTQPAKVSLEGGTLNVTDGFHKVIAAEILGQPLNVEVSVKENPLLEIHAKNPMIKWNDYLAQGIVAPEVHEAVGSIHNHLQSIDDSIPINLYHQAETSVGPEKRNISFDLNNQDHVDFLINDYGMTEEQINEYRDEGKEVRIRAEYIRGDIGRGGQTRPEIAIYDAASPNDIYEELAHHLVYTGRIAEPEGLTRAQSEDFAHDAAKVLLALDKKGKLGTFLKEAHAEKIKRESAAAPKTEGQYSIPKSPKREAALDRSPGIREFFKGSVPDVISSADAESIKLRGYYTDLELPEGRTTGRITKRDVELYEAGDKLLGDFHGSPKRIGQVVELARKWFQFKTKFDSEGKQKPATITELQKNPEEAYYSIEAKAKEKKAEPAGKGVVGPPKKFIDKVITATHWSPQKSLTVLDPKKYGKGVSGSSATVSERTKATYRGFIPRSFLGTEGYTKEYQLGDNMYKALLEGNKIYDMDKDPLGLYPTNEEMRKSGYGEFDMMARDVKYDNKILRAGFDGVYSDTHKVIMMFKPVSVESVPHKNKALPLSGKGSYSIGVLPKTFEEAVPDLKRLGWTQERIDDMMKDNHAKARANFINHVNNVRPEEEILPVYKAGEVNKEWYQQLLDNAVTLMKGDKKRADLLMKLNAAFSPNMSVELHLAAALKALYRYEKAGSTKDPRILKRLFQGLGLENSIDNAIRAIRGERLGLSDTTGNKVRSFEQNSIGNLDPVTLDVYMSFIYDKKTYHPATGENRWAIATDPIYSAVAMNVMKTSEKLGWKPAEGQAAAWSTAAALADRVLKGESPEDAVDNLTYGDIVSEDTTSVIKKGWETPASSLGSALRDIGITRAEINKLKSTEVKNPDRKIVEDMSPEDIKTLKAFAKELDNVRVQRELVSITKEVPTTLNFESMSTVDKNADVIAKLPYRTQMKMHKEIVDAIKSYIQNAAKTLGIKATLAGHSPGSWVEEGTVYSNPSSMYNVMSEDGKVLPLTKENRKKVEGLLAYIGYILDQAGMGYTKAMAPSDPRQNQPLAWVLTKEPLTRKEVIYLQKELGKKMDPAYFFIAPHEKGVYIGNVGRFEGKLSNEDFIDHVTAVLETSKISDKVTSWEEAENGGGFVGRGEESETGENGYQSKINDAGVSELLADIDTPRDIARNIKEKYSSGKASEEITPAQYSIGLENIVTENGLTISQEESILKLRRAERNEIYGHLKDEGLDAGEISEVKERLYDDTQKEIEGEGVLVPEGRSLEDDLREFNQEFVYHATYAQHVLNIQRKGLSREHAGDYVYFDNLGKRIHFDLDPSKALDFGNVLLRVRTEDLGEAKRIRDTEIASLADIPPENIEMLTSDGNWTRMREPGQYSISAAPFYSQLIRTVENKLQEMPSKVQNISNWLLKNNVKPAEIKWMGVEQWLKDNQRDGVINKTDFLNFLKENQIEIKEVTKGNIKELTEKERGRLVELMRKENTDDLTETERKELNRLSNRQIGEWEGTGDTKFAQYVLPGGENYRELLLTLPDKNKLVYSEDNVIPLPFTSFEASDPDRFWYFKTPDNVYQIPKSKHPDQEEARQYVIQKTPPDITGYKSSHWDEPNVLAHIRFNERTDADGKKVLFLEEVQSDWHQEGKKKGYAKPYENVVSKVQKNEEGLWEALDKNGDNIWTESFKGQYDTKETAYNRAEWYFRTKNPENRGVPAAPFAENWHEFIMKRMLRYAAENGYDKIAWTTGEQQADRYDLSKYIDNVKVKRFGDTYHLVATDKNNRTVIDKTGVTQKELPDVIGKELTNKIINEVQDSNVEYHDSTKYSGLDLKVGGEGMKSFYDNLIPGFMSRYVKQWGAKVGESKIDTTTKRGDAWVVYQDGEVYDGFRTEKQAKDFIGQFGKEDQNRFEIKYEGDTARASTVHSVDITPSMKTDVLEKGQPYYSIRANDAAYLKAVESGDMKTAQKMVDETAEKAGYNVEAYHGTNNKFYIFNMKPHDDFQGTSFFTPDKRDAKKYGKVVLNSYLKMDNPKYMDYDFSDDNIGPNGWGVIGDAQDAFDEGHDGIIFENIRSGFKKEKSFTQYAVFTPSQIKSADPVTYDDQGNVIPLSQRFNPENPDIRYSIRADLPEEIPPQYIAPDFKDHLEGYMSAIEEEMGKLDKESIIAGVDVAEDLYRQYLVDLPPEDVAAAEATIKPAIDNYLKARNIKPPVPGSRTSKTKHTIRDLTGQIRGENITANTYDLLLTRLRAEAAAAREGYSAGRELESEKAKAHYGSRIEAEKQRRRESLAKTIAKYRIKAALAKEHRRQQAEIRKMIEHLKTVESKLDKMDPVFRDRIKAVLEPFDLARMTEKTRLKLEDLKAELETNPDADIDPEWIDRIGRLDKTPIRDLTLFNMRILHDAIMHFAQLGIRGPQMKVAQKMIARDMILKTSLSEMKPEKSVVDNVVDIRYTKGRSFRGAMQGIKEQFGIHGIAWDALVESITGNDTMFYKILYRMIKDGIKQRDQLKYELEDEFINEMDRFQESYGIKDIADWLDETQDINMGDNLTLRLSRNQKLSFYRGAQDPDWRRSAEEGGFGLWADPNKSNPNRVFKLGKGGLDPIIASMTPAEKAFADRAIPNIIKSGNLIADKFLELNGYEMPMPEDGIYWRKDTMSGELGKDEEKELQKQHLGRPGIFKGMTKKRTKASLAVWLKPFTVAMADMHKRAADYVAMEEPISNAAWLLYKMRPEFEGRYGQGLWKEIEKGLKDISDVYALESSPYADKLFQMIRNNQTIYSLALNYGTMLKQLNGPFNYMVFVPPKYLAWALSQYVQNPLNVRKLHRRMSVEYRKRGEEGYTQDVGNVLSGLNQYGKKAALMKRAGAAGLRPLREIDLFGVDLGMLASVEYALDSFKNGMPDFMSRALDVTNEQVKKMSYGEQYKLAYEFAEWVTERTQAQNVPEHMSGWQRGNELEKQFSMFFSEVQKNLSGIYRAAKEMERGEDKAKTLMMKTLFFYIIIGSVLFDTGVNALRSKIRGQKPDTWWAGVTKNITGMVPIVRDIVQTLVDSMQGKYYPSGGDTPAARLQQAIVNPVANAVKTWNAKTRKQKIDAAWKTADSMANMVAMALGIPYPAMKEPYRIITREETIRKQKHKE